RFSTVRTKRVLEAHIVGGGSRTRREQSEMVADTERGISSGVQQGIRVERLAAGAVNAIEASPGSDAPGCKRADRLIDRRGAADAVTKRGPCQRTIVEQAISSRTLPQLARRVDIHKATRRGFDGARGVVRVEEEDRR